MDVIDLLIQDHRKVNELLSKWPTLSERTAKIKIFTQLSELLNVHAAFEELHFYPAYQQATQDAELIPNNFAEHQVMKDCLKKFRPDMTDLELDAVLQILTPVVQEHVQEEETVLFPQSREVIDQAVLDELGDAFEKARPNLTQQVSFTVTVLAEAAITASQEAGR